MVGSLTADDATDATTITKQSRGRPRTCTHTMDLYLHNINSQDSNHVISLSYLISLDYIRV